MSWLLGVKISMTVVKAKNVSIDFKSLFLAILLEKMSSTLSKIKPDVCFNIFFLGDFPWVRRPSSIGAIFYFFLVYAEKAWYGKNNISSNVTDVLVLQFA